MPPRARAATTADVDPVEHTTQCEAKARSVETGTTTTAAGVTHSFHSCSSCNANVFDPPLPPPCITAGCEQRAAHDNGMCVYHAGVVVNGPISL